MSSKKAFITGVTGQDGSYLAELLLEKGYEVHGLIRRSSSFNTARIDHIYQDLHSPNPKLFLHYGDLTDGVNMTNLIHQIQPTEVYNLGAQSHVQVSFTMPQYTAQVDAVGAVALLESIRASGVNCRYYQASTSELYGSTPPPQNELSAFRPRSPYAAAKLMAYWSTVNYREAYGVHATNGILFNHESPRRGETFVTRKITRAAARIATGSKEKLYLGNLEAVRDWGYAKEYVESMWLMLQQDNPEDFVIATGKQYSVREFVSACAPYFGMKIFWEASGLQEKGIDLNTNKAVIRIDEAYFRPAEVETLLGDASYAKEKLGWEPEISFDELVKDMCENGIR